MERYPSMSRCSRAPLLVAMLLSVSGPSAAFGQGSAPAFEAPDVSAWSFAHGETFNYSVAIGRFKLGEARLAVHDLEIIDGLEVVKTSLVVAGGPPFFRIEIDLSSWIDTAHFRSVRFERRVREGPKRDRDRYSMDTASGTFTAERWSEDLETYEPRSEGGGRMPEDAIDEIAFLYLVRTLPLVQGEEIRFDRYFKLASNPIVVRILGREEIRVPAGRFQTLVVEPILPGVGVFHAKRKPRVWVTDDERRIIVKVQTSAAVGPVALNLTDYEEGAPGP